MQCQLLSIGLWGFLSTLFLLLSPSLSVLKCYTRCGLIIGRWWRRNAAFQEVSRELRRISYGERSYHRGVKGEKREDERLWWRGV